MYYETTHFFKVIFMGQPPGRDQASQSGTAGLESSMCHADKTKTCEKTLIRRTKQSPFSTANLISPVNGAYHSD